MPLPSNIMADDNPTTVSTERTVFVEAGKSGGGGGGVDKRSEQTDPNPVTSSSPVRRSSTPGGTYKERRGNKEAGGQHQKRRGGGSGGGSGGKYKRTTSTTTTTEGTLADTSGGSAVGGGSKTGQQGGNNKKNTKGKYGVKRRAPPKEDFDIKPNDVFVNEKSHFVAQLSKCKKLFEKGHREVYLHGLGKAIPRAINIAFELKKFYHNTVDYTVNTSTLQVYDDIVDQEDSEQPASVRTRNVSSVDIKVYRSLNIP